MANHFFTALVGNGLTAAAQGESPTVGKYLKQGKRWRSQSL